jgi:hypothetical protein
VPNTLAQLNSFSNQSYAFEDQRAYSISFSANATTNQNVTTSEDSAFTSPVGINITSVVSQPGNITYNVDTSNIAGNAILTWPTLPSSVSSSSPATGVYRVTGIMDNVIWDQIRNPTIIAKDQAANFVYSANIQYPSTANTALTNTWSWTNSVTISNTHSELSNATDFTYDEDTAKTIPGTPTITDAYSGPLSHTLVITPNVANAVFTLSMAGNTSLDPVTKVLTIVDSKANINTGLGNLWLVPAPDYDLNFSLNYSLTNPVSNLNTQVNQAANIANTNQEWANTSVARTYEINTENYLFANTVPEILETVSGATYTVGLTLNSNIGIITTNTYASPTGWSTGNLTFTTTGNKATVNSTMGNIKFFPTGNITSSTTVAFSSARPSGPAFTDTFALNNSPIGNVFNFSATNTYDENTLKTILGNTITDATGLNTTYTVSLQQLSGNTGQWYVNGNLVGNATSAYVISNSQANINSANLQYLPAINNQGNVTILYNQVKTNYLGNVTQANVSAVYSLGNASSYVTNMISRSYTGNATNSIFSSSTPTISDGSNVGQTYTISLTSPVGKFGNSQSNAIAANSYSFTGNITQINSEFTNMKFVPNYGVAAGNSTFNYTQIRSGITQLNSNVVLTGTANNLSSITKEYVTATSDKTLTPTFVQYYWQRANILVAGGGGGGGPGFGGGGGGGGGGGEVNSYSAVQLPVELLTINIGAGGAGGVFSTNSPGSSGAQSNIVGNLSGILAYTGSGGGGGFPNNSSPGGGTSGNGFTGGYNSALSGGGGGGASAIGGNASGSTKGAGGAGIYSAMSGSNIAYANGGQGGNALSGGTTSSTYGGGGGGGAGQIGSKDGNVGTAGSVVIVIT